MTPEQFLRWCIDNYVTHDCHNDPECGAFIAAEQNRSEAHRALNAILRAPQPAAPRSVEQKPQEQ